MAAQPIDAALGSLLGRLGRPAAPLTVEPLRAGGNNRVFRVQTAEGALLAKWYFHSERDPRDRLRAEFSFLNHVWASGLRCVPQPVGCDFQLRLGLYEFIEGRQVTEDDIDQDRLLQAARFFAALNAAASRASAATLGAASEACFSIADHLATVDSRLGRFAGMRAFSGLDREADALIQALSDAWQRQKRRILAECQAPNDPLPVERRCLSPSDFGFHNALLRPDGSVCFFDFEYAGWDDPAKALGDFVAHPGVPVPARHREAFLREAAAPLEDARAVLERSRLLAPVFGAKWCCIILNEFLPEAAARRRFAHPEMDAETAKRAQLGKAERLVAELGI